MEKKVPEHLNMDSSAGSMPAPAVPDKLKQKAPQGELNPYAKHIAAPHKTEEIQKNHASGKGMEEAQLKGNWAKAINMLPSGDDKQAQIADMALQEQVKLSEKELQNRDKQLFQTWIQQNPVQAAMLQIDKDDPFDEKKGGSPLKYYKKSPLKAIYGQTSNPGVSHMSRNQAFNYGQKANKNWATEAGVAGGQILQEKFAQWDTERAAYKEKLKAQKDREAKELMEASKPLVQTLDNSQALDESTKQLLAQQWKQGYVENEKAYKNKEIDQYEYALKKQQALQNAEQYNKTVGNLTSMSEQFTQMLKDDKLSDGMPEEARDFWTSIASGKGMNIQKTEDGKAVANNGLSIQNVNGTPTMVGWTAGQVDQARKSYEALTQPDPLTGQPVLTPTETSFEAFLGSVPRPGDPGFEEKKQDPKYQGWIDGVNIPIANLASGEGLPEMLEKDESFNQNITSYADDIAQKAVNNASYPGPTSSAQLWEQSAAYSTEYINQMMGAMSEPQLRSVASDYLDMTPADIRRIMDTEGGVEALKEQMKPEMLNAVKLRFEADPAIAKLNQENRDQVFELAQIRARNANKSGSGNRQEDLELQQKRAQALAQGNYSQFVGQSSTGNKIEEITPIDQRSYAKQGLDWLSGGKAPPPEKFKVKFNGKWLNGADGQPELTEAELKNFIQDKYQIKGDISGQGQSAPLTNENPQLKDLDI